LRLRASLFAFPTGSHQVAGTSIATILYLAESQRAACRWLEWSLDARLSALNVLARAGDPLASTMRNELESDARKNGFGWVVSRLEDKSTGK